MAKAHPVVCHLVISLAPGGLERLVVDWTNARNRRYPGLARIVCLDTAGDLAGQVENDAVMCVEAKRSRFPWDREAVRRIVGVLEDSGVRSQESGAEGDLVIHTHNLAAWQYGVLAKIGWKTSGDRLQTVSEKNSEHKAAKNTKEEGNSPQRHRGTEENKCCGNFAHGNTCLRQGYGGQVVGENPATLSEGIPGARSTGSTGSTSSPQANSLQAVSGQALRQCSGQERGDTSTLKTSSPPLSLPPRRVAGISSREGGIKCPQHWFYSLSRCLGVSVVKSSSSRSSRASVQTFSRLRLVYTQHGANVHNMGMRDRIRARLLVCFTDEIVAVSEATAAVMAKAMWISRSRIRVIPNGIEVGKFGAEQESGVSLLRQDYGGHGRQESASFGSQGGTPAAMEVRMRFGIPTAAFVIGSVGRLAHVKGYDRLIAVVAKLSRAPTTDLEEEKSIEQKHTENAKGGIGFSAMGGEQNSSSCASRSSVHNLNIPQSDVCSLRSNVFLLLVGDGPERANLERQARELGVVERVVFAGYQTDPVPYLAVMNVFVLPSRSEGLSVALLEAMAAGVPVAVTDVGENRRVIDDGRCGVVLTEDTTDWPTALIGAMTDNARVRERVTMAQQRVLGCYSMKTTLDGYEQLYGGGQEGEE